MCFYTSNRIPVTLPIIIAITALCRLIVLNSKDADPLVLMAEAGAILVLSIAAYLMSLKDKLSLEKRGKMSIRTWGRYIVLWKTSDVKNKVY